MEARSFTKQPKTLSFGTKPFHVFGEGTPVVVVEDVFSAIRVGRVTSAVPLFGSVLSADWSRLLTRLSLDVILWLDSDKYREAIKFARQLQLLGANTRVIRTELDPKGYTEQEVREILDKWIIL
jgi:DNA primase